MNNPVIISTLLLFAGAASAQGAGERDAVVELVSPKDGETVYSTSLIAQDVDVLSFAKDSK